MCGLVRGLRPCHPLPVACVVEPSLGGLYYHPHRHWPLGPHLHECPRWVLPLCLLVALVLGAVTHPDDCVGSGHYILAVCRRTMTVGALVFQSVTRDVQLRCALICWSCATYFLPGHVAAGLRMFSPSRSGYIRFCHSFPTQRCIV